jgi:hypothetical protein
MAVDFGTRARYARVGVETYSEALKSEMQNYPAVWKFCFY